MKPDRPRSPEDIRDLADYLAASPGELHTLDLRRKCIGDAGLEVLFQALKVNTSLASLDLSENEIGAAGAASLAEALKLNTNMALLNLSNNEIDETGAAFLSEALKFNTSLASLGLSNNGIDAVNLESINQALADNRTLRDSLLPASIGLELASGCQYPSELMPLIIRQMCALPGMPNQAVLDTIGGLADSVKPPVKQPGV